MKYTFCNTGTYFDFNPADKIFPQPNKPAVKNIDFYKELVSNANKSDVYILDNSGKVLPDIKNVKPQKEWEPVAKSNKIGRNVPFTKW